MTTKHKPKRTYEGEVKIAPGANRAGGPALAHHLLYFLKRVSARLHHPVTVTTGTNHNQFTVNGNVSDHWDGHAADLAMPWDSSHGDALCSAALQEAGVSANDARHMAKNGGLWTIWPERKHHGHRIQVIWKTYQGGNHHNHVHIGVR